MQNLSNAEDSQWYVTGVQNNELYKTDFPSEEKNMSIFYWTR